MTADARLAELRAINRKAQEANAPHRIAVAHIQALKDNADRDARAKREAEWEAGAPERARLKAEKDARDREEHYRFHMQMYNGGSGIPTRYAKAALSDFPESVLKAIPASRTSLVLTGPNGTGKTRLAVAIMRGWQAPGRCSTDRFIEADTITEENAEELADFLGVLLIDDLDAVVGKHYGTPKLAPVRTILNRRYSWERTTIVTGNRSLADWGEWDTAIQSRLYSFQEIILAGTDRRLGEGA